MILNFSRNRIFYKNNFHNKSTQIKISKEKKWCSDRWDLNYYFDSNFNYYWIPTSQTYSRKKNLILPEINYLKWTIELNELFNSLMKQLAIKCPMKYPTKYSRFASFALELHYFVTDQLSLVLNNLQSSENICM